MDTTSLVDNKEEPGSESIDNTSKTICSAYSDRIEYVVVCVFLLRRPSVKVPTFIEINETTHKFDLSNQHIWPTLLVYGVLLFGRCFRAGVATGEFKTHTKHIYNTYRFCLSFCLFVICLLLCVVVAVVHLNGINSLHRRRARHRYHTLSLYLSVLSMAGCACAPSNGIEKPYKQIHNKRDCRQ